MRKVFVLKKNIKETSLIRLSPLAIVAVSVVVVVAGVFRGKKKEKKKTVELSFHGRRSLDGQSFTGSFVHCLVFLFPVHAATFDMSRKKPSNGRCLRAGLAIL